MQGISGSAPSIPVGNGDVAEFTCISRDNLMNHIKTKGMVVLTEFMSLISSDVFSFIFCYQWCGG